MCYNTPINHIFHPGAHAQVAKLGARPCIRQTPSGRSCKNWAVHGTESPTCAAHANSRTPGIPAGLSATPRKDKNRLANGSTSDGLTSRGFYSQTFSPQELADLLKAAEEPGLGDEIAATRVAIRRILETLEDRTNLADKDFHTAISLIYAGAATIGRLLRTEHDIQDPTNQIDPHIAEALDELSERWGIRL